jgi:hypothetical protein
MYDSKYNDAHNLVFKVTDRATSYDWMASSSESAGCDYLVQVRAFTIDCGGGPQAAYVFSEHGHRKADQNNAEGIRMTTTTIGRAAFFFL